MIKKVAKYINICLAVCATTNNTLFFDKIYIKTKNFYKEVRLPYA